MSVVLSKSLKTELYRKAVHLSSLWMSLFIFLADRNVSIVTFSLLLALNLIVEYAAYRKTAVVGDLFRRMFIRTLRNREVCRERFVPQRFGVYFGGGAYRFGLFYFQGRSGGNERGAGGGHLCGAGRQGLGNLSFFQRQVH